MAGIGVLAVVACQRPAPTPAAAPSPVSPTPAAPVAEAPPPPVATAAAVAEAPAAAAVPAAPAKIFDIRVGRVAKNKTLAAALSELGLRAEEVAEVIRALKGVFDFRKSRVGDQVRVAEVGGRVESVEYRSSPVDEWLVSRQGEKLVGAKRPVVIEKKVLTVDLAVDSSLYEAMADAGEEASLAGEIADVFAWDVDFYRDVRKGDRVRVVVEKEFAQGRLLRYGEILGARYEGNQVRSKRLLRYAPIGSTPTYFDEKGNSAKKSFLKSPLKYVRITSGFGGRINPLSGFQQNHAGVDYAAEIGTPVWAVADGTVTQVVRGDPGGGNYLFLRHMNGLETGYLHLSRFAEGIRVGARVHQKQVVAFSGSTGMSTGPHLHYAMKRGGGYINPLAQRFPRADPLPKDEIERFHERTAHVASLLDAELVAARNAAAESRAAR
jgi:murein DD-endopeptidase MepM/ murein hydrolase activator NlpD